MTVVTQGDVEARIQRLVADLEDGTVVYQQALEAAAQAEAEFKAKYHRALVALADSGRKMTADERKARAMNAAEDLHRTHLITDAAREAARDHQFTVRAALDATRTLSANVRAQT